MAIETVGLTKAFGDKTVLDGIDLAVAEGEIFSLLGPNGAGKTTMVQILSTLLRPDGGRASVGGHDVVDEPDAVRALIGVTGQFSAVDGLLSAAENLRLMADLHHLARAEGRERAADLLERFELASEAKTLAATFSGGMRRKLDLAMTLMGSPRIVFLDEPTTGLDPRARRTMWDLIRGLARDGVTILLTTQYLDEADQLADRIAILDGGRVVAQGRPSELKKLVPGGQVRLRFPDLAQLDAAARTFGEGHATADGDTLTLQVPSQRGVASLRAVLDRLDGLQVESLSMDSPDLDDVFLAMTGQTDHTSGDRR